MKQKTAQRIVDNMAAVLLWYTAWLIAAEKKLEEGANINAIVDEFMAEDEDMVRRFFFLPQRGE